MPRTRFHISTIRADNGKECTDRHFAPRQRAATGKYEFDQLCTALISLGELPHKQKGPGPKSDRGAKWSFVF